MDVKETARPRSTSAIKHLLSSIRYQAVEMFLGGASAEDIAETFGLCRTTIYKWLDMYNEGGLGAL